MNAQMKDFYAGKAVLITGVCGTVGQELLRQLLQIENIAVTGIDNNESELFFLEEQYAALPHVEFFLGDLRDQDTLRERFRGHDIVFHAAAFKHVGLSERSPRDAIHCNVIGTQNVIEAAIAANVSHVNFTSSDKAANPTTVMGTSKLLGERLITAAAINQKGDGPIFFSTRFGNVLGSRGSVIPLFRRQISQGGPVTLTHKSMTRFIMTIEQSVKLVMQAACLARGGEVFVTKMPVANILDLAMVMVEEFAPAYGYTPRDIAIETIGPRRGEKMYEELLSSEESRRARLDGDFIVINPPTEACPEDGEAVRAYNSSVEAQMSRADLRAFLASNGLLETDKRWEDSKCA